MNHCVQREEVVLDRKIKEINKIVGIMLQFKLIIYNNCDLSWNCSQIIYIHTPTIQIVVE